MNEVKVLQRLKHEHIVRYVDSFVSESGKLCICMEWASGGDIGALLGAKKKAGGRFSEAELIRMVWQMASALSYCHHEVKLLHRDLKPANIFLDKRGEIKIGDFGISKVSWRVAGRDEDPCSHTEHGRELTRA
jgi:NIMA (never in mitosis gene a)-related kinase